MMSHALWACALASLALLGCSSCPPPSSTASTFVDPVTLDATTPEAAFTLSIHAPEQSCGCTWCGDPKLSLELSGDVIWTNPPGATDYPVVRVTLTPKFKMDEHDSLDPPLPLDVVLTPQAIAKKPVLTASHLCPEGEACDIDYALTVARVDSAPAGAVTAVWSIGAEFVSKPDGTLSVTVKR